MNRDHATCTFRSWSLIEVVRVEPADGEPTGPGLRPNALCCCAFPGPAPALVVPGARGRRAGARCPGGWSSNTVSASCCVRSRTRLGATTVTASASGPQPGPPSARPSRRCCSARGRDGEAHRARTQHGGPPLGIHLRARHAPRIGMTTEATRRWAAVVGRARTERRRRLVAGRGSMCAWPRGVHQAALLVARADRQPTAPADPHSPAVSRSTGRDEVLQERLLRIEETAVSPTIEPSNSPGKSAR